MGPSTVTPLPGGEVGPDETGPGLNTSWLAPEAGWRRGTQLEDHGTDSSLAPYQTPVYLTVEEP